MIRCLKDRRGYKFSNVINGGILPKGGQPDRRVAQRLPSDGFIGNLYPVADPTAACFVHIHGGYWQRGSKEIFACLAEGALANGWSAALPGYTLAPEASL